MDENRGEQMSLTPTAPRGDLKRRGLFAMGAALLGVAAAKLAGPAPTVEAAAGGPVLLGTDNDAGTTRTQISANVANENVMSLIQANSTGNALVGVNNGDGGGLVGSVTGVGTALAGISQKGIGLSGTSFAAANAATPFAGVAGFSQHSFGVRGGTGATAQEVGSGVLGEGGAQTGVQATSTSGVALIATVTGGTAGQFNGAVVTNGNLTVNGTFTATGIKSAAVPSGNGLVRLYCMENPESYFEDFGEGTMSSGQGSAPMSPDFAALVDTSSAKIFLTEIGNLGGLYVNGVSNGSFSIASRSTTANGNFTYRIVAKRKDVQAPRLQDVPVDKGTSNYVAPRQPDAPARLPGVH